MHCTRSKNRRVYILKMRDRLTVVLLSRDLELQPCCFPHRRKTIRARPHRGLSWLFRSRCTAVGHGWAGDWRRIKTVKSTIYLGCPALIMVCQLDRKPFWLLQHCLIILVCSGQFFNFLCTYFFVWFTYCLWFLGQEAWHGSFLRGSNSERYFLNIFHPAQVDISRSTSSVGSSSLRPF